MSFLKGPLLLFWSLALHQLFTVCIEQSTITAEWRNHYCAHSQVMWCFLGRAWCLIIDPFLYYPLFLRCLRGWFLIRCISFCLKTPFLICNLDLSETDPPLKNLLLHTQHIINALDSRHQLDTIMVDFRKAFNTVPHDKLLVKLCRAGVTGSVWMLFKSYLYDRRQCVKMDDQCSECVPACSLHAWGTSR